MRQPVSMANFINVRIFLSRSLAEPGVSGFQRHDFLHIIALHFGDATVTVFGEKAVNDEAVDILRAGT